MSKAWRSKVTSAVSIIPIELEVHDLYQRVCALKQEEAKEWRDQDRGGDESYKWKIISEKLETVE